MHKRLIIFLLYFIIFFLFITGNVFSQTLPPNHLVSHAIDKTLLDMSIPSLKVIKQGSWISGINYRPITDISPSDFDSRLFIEFQDISKEEAFRLWREFRFKLQRNLIDMAKKAGYDSSTIGKIRALTNFYPPEQLMKHFSSTNEAVDFFLERGVYPSLGEVGEEGAEGLYGKFTKFIRQSFEQGERVQVSQLILGEDGEWKFFHKGTAEAEHLIEGKVTKNITGYVEAVEHAINETKKALKEGRLSVAEKQIKRAKEYLKEARSLVNLSSSAESEILEKLNLLEKSFEGLKKSVLSESGISAKEFVKLTDDITKKLGPIESEILVETNLLKGLKQAKNPKTRYLLKGLLENEKNFRDLRGKLITLSDDSIKKGLIKEFSQWILIDFLNFWNLKQLDDAIKKGEVGVSNLVIPALLNYFLQPTTVLGWTALFTEIYMVTVSLAIQYFESTGYFALIKDQDCMDLVAGIYTLKGREQRIFEKKCEEIVDSKQLACRIYDHHGLRRHLLSGGDLKLDLIPPLLTSILKCHADNASIHYDEMSQSKHDERISRALIEKCTPVLIKEWIEERNMVVYELDILRQELTEMELKLSVKPERITKKTQINLTLTEPGLERIEKEITEKIKCLGGVNAQPKFFKSYTWEVNGKKLKRNFDNNISFNLEEVGQYEFCVDAKYEWYVTGLSKISLEEGISGVVSKRNCKSISFHDENKDKADNLWNQCIELAKVKQYEEALQKCEESLTYWSDEKRINAVNQLREQARKEKIAQEEKERLEREKLEKERKENAKKGEKPSCTYEYSDWGECSRATKKQTRTVIAKKPEGCEERQKPVLEQGCTPPLRTFSQLTKDERNNLLSCLCNCSCGGPACRYVPPCDKDPGGVLACPCVGMPPCQWGEWGCNYTYFKTTGECIENCFKNHYVVFNAVESERDIRAENRKHMKPLKVKISPDTRPIKAQYGDVVTLKAEVQGGMPSYAFKWSGDGMGKDGEFIFAKGRKAGSYPVSVTVTDSDANTATASTTIVVEAMKVKLTMESPKEKTLPIGSKANLIAEVLSGDKPASGTFYYQWQPHPEVVFGDPKNLVPETTGGAQSRNTALFKRTGNFKIWVDAFKEIEGRKVKVGESEQIPINVVNPKLNLKVSKTDPLVGDKVVVTVQEEPKMSDEFVSFWWEYSGNIDNPGPEPNIPNSRSYSFKPKDTKPITITVHGKAKDGGDDLGEAKITITAKSYQVAISQPRYLGPKPRIWKCDTQFGGACPGLVEVADTQFAVFRDIFMKATVTPTPESPRYRWSIDPPGSCGFPGAGDEIKLNCSQTGTYTVKVEVTNADGTKLGEATQTVTVSISDEMLKQADKSKQAYDKVQHVKQLVGQGKLDEAINIAQEAVSLDPKNQEAKSLSNKWKNERDSINKNIENINKFIIEKKFADAEKELNQAKALHPKYAKVTEAEKRLKEEKDKYQREVTNKINEAKRLLSEKKIDEAVSLIKEVAKIDKNSAQPVMNQISQEAKNIGWDALHHGDYKLAIKRLEQALELNPNDTDAQKKLKEAKDYQAKMPQIEAKMKEFDQLIVEKKIVSSYQKMLEIQDILRSIGSSGQSSNNPVIIKYNKDYNELNKWYNGLIQKTNTEWTRLFQQKDWISAEKLLIEVLKYEHTEANRKNYESSLQMVRGFIAEERNKKQRADQLWDECINLTKQNRHAEALSKCKESLNISPDEKRRQALAQFEQEVAKKKKADELWNQCINLAKANRLNEAVSMCEQSLTYWSNEERIKVLNSLKAETQKSTEQAQRKSQADRLWEECIALAKANRLDEAMNKCEQSLSYWSSEDRQRAYNQLKSTLQKTKEDNQNKQTADRLWNECIEFARQKNYEQAWRKCDESLKYWRNDQRVEATAKLKEEARKISTPSQPEGSSLSEITPLSKISGNWNGHTYQAVLVPEGITWHEAKIAAEHLGGYLAVITSAAENDFIYNLIKNDDRFWYLDSYRNGIGPWIGGYQPPGSPEPAGGWRWITNESFSYSNWASGEPNNAGGNENRIHFFGFQTLKGPGWNDLFENVKVKGYIVEFDSIKSITSISTPAGTLSSGKGQIIFSNGNIAGVYNNPTRATTFTINQPYVITLIQNYHWNNSRGSTPGTIGLRDQSGRTYGPWQAKGSPGQGGVPNAYWTVYPNITLSAGTYTVIDSEPSTWAQNSGSGGAGHTRIEGYPAEETGNQQIGNTIQQGRTLNAEITNASRENVHIFVEGQDTFGSHNRVTPGERKTVSIKAPAQAGFINFVAGRNGQVLAKCRWEYVPDYQNRVPIVRFSDPNILSCSTGVI